MSLPKAVQALGERAEAHRLALLGGGVPPAPQPVPQPTHPAPAPEPAPAPTPAAPAAPIDSVQVQPASAPADDTTEHRFKVLQGKYNAEVPRLLTRAEQAEQELEELRRVNQHLSEQLKAIPPESRSLVKPEEVNEYGEGLIDVVRRAAREELQAQATVVEELRQKLSRYENTSAAKTKAGFVTDLAQAVPDWVVINDDHGFHRWLAEKDVLSGETRQSLLERAQAAFDATRAAAIFNAFRKDRDSWVAKADSALSNQVVPGSGSSGNPPALPNTQARIWTRAEISDKYNQMRAGRLTGEEAKAAEAEIQRAMAEGRVK